MVRPDARKKYPKNTFFAATAEHPRGYETIDSCYTWPDLFLQRLSTHYGCDWLCKRLQAWKWTFSTCFSGVGAPESALNPAKLVGFNQIVKARSPLASEATQSVTEAANKFLAKKGKKRGTKRPILSEFTCEIDKHCRRVLRETYGNPCNWSDITKLNAKKETAFCTTHGRHCPIRKHQHRKRVLIATR